MSLNLTGLEDRQTKNCKEKQDYFLKKAATYAVRSNVKNHKHGCVIVKDGEVIADGFNHHVNHYEHTFTIHAEVDALTKVKKLKNILSECELYVVRIGTDLMGNPLKYSRPCVNCTKAILKAGIKKVYFSTDDEFNNIFKNWVPPDARQQRKYHQKIEFVKAVADRKLELSNEENLIII
jgi:dCMP deaminase